MNDLTEATRRANGLAQDVAKSEQRTKYQALTAPIDGTVQQLAIHSVGGVVTPAQTLLSIDPAGSTIKIEAMVENQDVGFVHPGQEAAIKVDNFKFTRYGLLQGKVVNLSRACKTSSFAATDFRTSAVSRRRLFPPIRMCAMGPSKWPSFRVPNMRNR